MQCSKCQAKLKVVDTADDGTAVYRVRKCPSCSHKIITMELPLDDGHVGKMHLAFYHRYNKPRPC